MNDWLEAVPFFASSRYYQIRDFLKAERKAGKSILPAESDVFNALKYTPLERVKVVILGQDPYPNKHHAHGLAFSIPPGEPDIPKSLKNILKELETDTGISAPGGTLIPWAKQGVLLLNRILTVEEGKSNSHKGIGWEDLTEDIMRVVSNRKEHVAFILWGRQAQRSKKFIDVTKHMVHESPHPSPLSAYRGFFDSKPFSTVNSFLVEKGMEPVDWRL